MLEWVRIENQEMMERFLNTVEGLHDSILREAVLQNAGYVDVDGWMHGDLCLPSIRLLFQSQSPRVIGVEILLEAVSELALKFPREFDEVEGEVLEQSTILHPLGRSKGAKIVCKMASYRMLGIGSRGMKCVEGPTAE
ncbi:MAG TPA: hypothetical protein VGI45_34245 [Terracidiphilus sp.]|jgi:hypothetical protein